jgi:PIN domain nuclease of toxin-antitoxin system
VRVLLDTHAFLWWLAEHHQDPWDRMLVAQAQSEGLALVSNDTQLDRYGVSRIW